MKRPYNGPWVKVRKVVLERDGYLCQIRLPGCTHQATQVDHVVPLQLGGPRLEMRNLRAACAHCNIARGNQTSPRTNNGRYKDEPITIERRLPDAAPSRDW